MRGRSSTPLCAALVAAALATAAVAQRPAWRLGDVFLAAGDGSYHVFDRNGLLKESLSSGDGGFTTDCGFAPDLERLWTANFTHSRLVAYAETGGIGVKAVDVDTGGGRPSSMVFDAVGNVLVAYADGPTVQLFDMDALPGRSFTVELEGRGVTGLDLARDQRTLFYASGARHVLRFDAGGGAQLPDFAALPGDGHATALRLLPPGDGSGGLVVADGVDLKRLDGAGRVVQRYDAPGLDAWFALSLDPDGRTLWATDHESDSVYRFDLETGAVGGRFVAGPGNTVFGVCVKGEPTAAVPRPALPTAFALQPNRPNPFNPTTQIRYLLTLDGPVRLSIYNMLGQQVRRLVQDHQAAGSYTVAWDGTDDAGRGVASGVYLCRLESGSRVESRRMLLLK